MYSRKWRSGQTCKTRHRKKKIPIEETYHNAHSSLHWLHRTEPYQYGKPFKDPIRNYQKYRQQKELAQQKEHAKKYSHIDKWINNNEIDLENSNNFWNNRFITDSQIIQLLKFRIGKYMGNTRKHTFYPKLYPKTQFSLKW
jgi:hypothetical protein